MCQETKIPANINIAEARTIGAPIPSTPKKKEIPSSDDQTVCSWNWKPPAAWS
ncbi:MAG: hypothetical protein MPW14_08570 [Candidatus Manganitrophus sp.]|nr:MAG: hypothetical protein MPW14_08570 [Candidatus Manganitrophus sp.]